MAKPSSAPKHILAFDIGGSHVKFLASGETEPRRVPSGSALAPAKMVERIRALTRDWDYDGVSIGYCGLVGFDFAAAFGYPVRIVNDAAMQALGSYDGGRVLFLGLGTRLGAHHRRHAGAAGGGAC